jgi:hypothetical protein
MRFIIILSVIVIFTFNYTITWAEGTAEAEQESAAKEEPALEIFTGYLVDVTCGTTGRGMDGSNLVTNPEEHTKHCLEVCAASGFGIMILNRDEETYRFVEFDSKGTSIAGGILEMLSEGQSAKITVTGVLENNVISVSVIVLE